MLCCATNILASDRPVRSAARWHGCVEHDIDRAVRLRHARAMRRKPDPQVRPDWMPRRRWLGIAHVEHRCRELAFIERGQEIAGGEMRTRAPRAPARPRGAMRRTDRDRGCQLVASVSGCRHMRMSVRARKAGNSDSPAKHPTRSPIWSRPRDRSCGGAGCRKRQSDDRTLDRKTRRHVRVEGPGDGGIADRLDALGLIAPHRRRACPAVAHARRRRAWSGGTGPVAPPRRFVERSDARAERQFCQCRHERVSHAAQNHTFVRTWLAVRQQMLALRSYHTLLRPYRSARGIAMIEFDPDGSHPDKLPRSAPTRPMTMSMR